VAAEGPPLRHFSVPLGPVALLSQPEYVVDCEVSYLFPMVSFASMLIIGTRGSLGSELNAGITARGHVGCSHFIRKPA